MPELGPAGELGRRLVEELLCCPVCLEPCAGAKILKYCGHFFCLPCLTAIYSKSEPKGSMRCPLCNYKSKLSTSGLFGQKKTPKPQDLRKLIPDCRTLRLLGTTLGSPLGPGAIGSPLTGSPLAGLLNCRLCRSRPSNHRMLPFCQHSFCLPCLQSLYHEQNPVKPNGSRGSIVCPTCDSRIVFVSAKKTTPPPAPEVIGNLLPVDYALSTLLSAI